jgi:hypothetical protein
MGAIWRQYCRLPADGTRRSGSTLDHNPATLSRKIDEIT